MIFHCQEPLIFFFPPRDGAPYCEKDYQIHFGVQCEACHQFITGKVLEVRQTHTQHIYLSLSDWVPCAGTCLSVQLAI